MSAVALHALAAAAAAPPPPRRAATTAALSAAIRAFFRCTAADDHFRFWCASQPFRSLFLQRTVARAASAREVLA